MIFAYESWANTYIPQFLLSCGVDAIAERARATLFAVHNIVEGVKPEIGDFRRRHIAGCWVCLLLRNQRQVWPDVWD